MSETYQITVTTQDREEFTGRMARRQPELINGFVALSMENGDWMYFPPSDVKRFHFALVSETMQPEQPGQPAAEQTEELAEQQTAENAEKQDEASHEEEVSN